VKGFALMFKDPGAHGRPKTLRISLAPTELYQEALQRVGLRPLHQLAAVIPHNVRVELRSHGYRVCPIDFQPESRA
jgi:hypothetical protein